MLKTTIPLIILLILGCGHETNHPEVSGPEHLKNARNLTKNTDHSPKWDNAEAYFSFDDRQLVFQATRREGSCDQIYTIDLDGSDLQMVSNGLGRTTCPYFYPDGSRVVYASTHLSNEDCPPEPDHSRGYVWPIYDSFDIFVIDRDGTNLQQLTHTDGYDAEATISPKGDRIVFTSTRDGDLDLYTMNLDGSDVQRVTRTRGYDGGAFFSPDGKKLVYRSRHPKTPKEMEEYEALLSENLTRPSRMDIYVSDADGSNQIQVTDWGEEGITSFAPFFHPDGERIIFASNRDDFDTTLPNEYGFNFELYMIGVDGTGLERITFNDGFDGFPMFSSDGKILVWCGNYDPEHPRDTDIMLADWID